MSEDRTQGWVQRAAAARFDARDLIDGRRRDAAGSRALLKVGPRDGGPLYSVEVSDESAVRSAVAAARRAFDDARWAGLPPGGRKRVLQRLADLIEQHADELALFETLDAGKPISNARNVDVPAAAATIRFAAELADKVPSSVYGADQTSLSYQLRQPYGVVAGLVGWNFPLVLAAQKVGPALAAGNSLVLKPSELTSLSAGRLAELALEAGVPDGVLNVVHGDGKVGAALASHDDVDLLTFTGSTQTARKLIVASAQSNMKRLILECGGKAPNIVFEDCPDLASVADAVVARAFWNQGQVCTASSRLLVAEPIRQELLALIVERADALTPGDPLQPDTRFGALVGPAHAEKVRSYIRDGQAEGARVVHQSVAAGPFPDGCYVGPTIFDGVSAEHRIAQEEIFGPVLSVMSFEGEEQAIAAANSTIYGLSAIVWTKDLGRAHRVAHAVQAGWIVVNATAKPVGGLSPGALTVGGHKASGWGVEGGLQGLEEYLRQSTVQLYV